MKIFLKTKVCILLIIILFNIINLFAQDKVLIVDFEIVGEDTIFFSKLPEVEILEFKNEEERNYYFLLKRRVLKVYPYALIAKQKLDNIESGIDSIPKKWRKKRYTKKVAKWVKEEYSDRLKNLTISEGKILVKLIYRETNTSSYEILKIYRGSLNALFWQTIARFWDNNLKTKYDPVKIREDMLIEHILIQAKIEGKFK